MGKICSDLNPGSLCLFDHQKPQKPTWWFLDKFQPTSAVFTQPAISRGCKFLGFNLMRAQSVKNLPAVQETRVWSLGWESPLEKEMATNSSILAWKISWTEELHAQRTGCSPWGRKELGMTEWLALHYTILLEKIFSFISLIHKQTKDYIETHTEYIVAIIIFK